jgi:uncharacterized protein YqeY
VADSLKDQLHEEMTAAMRAGDRTRLGALRLLAAAVTNREKEVLHGLSDDEVREVAAKEFKKRSESIQIFEEAGRQELADKERAERDVLTAYAPPQLDDAAVDALVDEAIAATGATTMQDLGRVMGMAMSKAKGQVDGALVQQKVRERLGG